MSFHLQAFSAEQARSNMQQASGAIQRIQGSFDQLSSEQRSTAIENILSLLSDIGQRIPLTESELHREYDQLFTSYDALHARTMQAATTVLSLVDIPDVDAEEDDEIDADDIASEALIRHFSDRLPYGAAIPLTNLETCLNDGLLNYAIVVMETIERDYPAVAAELYRAVPKDKFLDPDYRIGAKIGIKALLIDGIVDEQPYMNGHGRSPFTEGKRVTHRREESDPEVKPLSLKERGLLIDIATLVDTIPDMHNSRPVPRSFWGDMKAVVVGAYTLPMREKLKNVAAWLADDTPGELLGAQEDVLRDKSVASLKAKLNELQSSYPELAERLFTLIPKADFFDEDQSEYAYKAIEKILS